MLNSLTLSGHRACDYKEDLQTHVIADIITFMHLSMVSATPPPRPPSGTYRRLVGFDIGCGQQQMALRIDQLLTPNHGAFDLINVKSLKCP